MNWNILQILQDDKHNYSSMRFMTLLVVGVILYNWVYTTMISGMWISIDMNAVFMLLVAMGAKVAQKGIETKNGNGVPNA